MAFATLAMVDKQFAFAGCAGADQASISTRGEIARGRLR
jgi:hypothetical protein